MGCMCNHSSGQRNARVSFEPFPDGNIACREQKSLLPRVPVLVATKTISAGEEVLIRYGSDKPLRQEEKEDERCSGGSMLTHGMLSFGKNWCHAVLALRSTTVHFGRVGGNCHEPRSTDEQRRQETMEGG